LSLDDTGEYFRGFGLALFASEDQAKHACHRLDGLVLDRVHVVRAQLRCQEDLQESRTHTEDRNGVRYSVVQHDDNVLISHVSVIYDSWKDALKAEAASKPPIGSTAFQRDFQRKCTPNTVGFRNASGFTLYKHCWLV
jgi:hypothetical protein